MSTPPPAGVLDAFDIREPPRRLRGGQETSWVAGDVVLKPGGGPVHAWFGSVAPLLAGDGFRLAPPLRSRSGAWTVDGWSATPWLAGRPPDLSRPESWATVLEAGQAVHRALARLDRPQVLTERTDWWALADRAAWRELHLDLRPEFEEVATSLRHLLTPLGDDQVVHGDLTHNVLVEPGLAPAVIDFSPYWRPVAYAHGVVVADALCWHRADPALIERSRVPVGAIARALLFRLHTTALRLDAGFDDLGPDGLAPFRRAAALLAGG